MLGKYVFRSLWTFREELQALRFDLENIFSWVQTGFRVFG